MRQVQLGAYSFFKGEVFSQNIRNRLDLMSTSAGPETEDDSYLGYSLALGDFTGSRLRAGLTGSRYKRTKGSDLAVGMPRGANLTGKVFQNAKLFFTSCKRFLFCWEKIMLRSRQSHVFVVKRVFMPSLRRLLFIPNLYNRKISHGLLIILFQYTRQVYNLYN